MLTSMKSILIVDDDSDIRANVKDILDELGFRTDVAGDGLSALELVRHNFYDVALLDFKLPGMDGVELSREIKKLNPGTAVIMITAYAGSQCDVDGGESVLLRVLQKPVDVEILLPLVQDACA